MNYLIMAGIAIAIAVVSILIFVSLTKVKKTTTNKKASKVAYSKKLENELRATREAIKFLAANAGVSSNDTILALDTYDLDESVINTAIEVSMANKSTVVGSKKDRKLSKLVSKKLK